MDAGFLVEALPVPGHPSASSEPCKGALHHPPSGQEDEALGAVAALDDLHIELRQDRFHGGAERRALIAAVGVELQQERLHAEQRGHHKRAAIAVLDAGGMHDGVDQEALRVDENMPLLALDLFARIIARRINFGPPFSALLTLWLSMMQAVGEASRDAASRHFT
jgi:hypothetical protein